MQQDRQGNRQSLRGTIREVAREVTSDAARTAVPGPPPRVTHTAPLALVVDGSPLARDRAARFLAETDLDPITCASGEAAVAVLQSCGADVALVLAGPRLSGAMDGARLARAVGRLWPGIRLVVGRDETGDETRDQTCTLPAGAVRLHRPWLPLDVLVQAHVAVQASRQASRQTARQAT